VTLTLSDVSKTYFDGAEVHALRPTTLEITQGELVTIAGPSGSGKSTLLNVLSLLDVPTAGQYRLNSVEVTYLSEATRGAIRARTFGFVFQAFHLLAGRTVVENVELGMLYRQVAPRERRRRAVSALERVGLTARATANPQTLSGGERQRVAIARAVCGSPGVLLCDEPTGSLDSSNAQNIVDLIHSLNGDGMTVIIVTHDEGIARLGRRRLKVSDGVVSDEM
jgi:putative ABC transport system ATP-binding protein